MIYDMKNGTGMAQLFNSSLWVGMFGGAISTVLGLIVAHMLSNKERRATGQRAEFEALLKGYKERVEQLEQRENELENEILKIEGKCKLLQESYDALEERHMMLWRRYQTLKEQNGGNGK